MGWGGGRPRPVSTVGVPPSIIMKYRVVILMVLMVVLVARLGRGSRFAEHHDSHGCPR